MTREAERACGFPDTGCVRADCSNAKSRIPDLKLPYVAAVSSVLGVRV